MLPVTKLLKSLFILSLCLHWSCSSNRLLSRKQARNLETYIGDSPVFSKSFTGFALYDPAAGKMIYQKDADKYFTPASNTKIFTLYTALSVLGDSLPVLHYTVAEDSLIFWGTANPLSLHPDFRENDAAFNFLKTRPGRLFFSDHNFDDRRFGPGWAWDDYSDYYQPENSSMPLYGNVVIFKKKEDEEGALVIPAFFKKYLSRQPAFYGTEPYIKRLEGSNIYEHNLPAIAKGKAYERSLPFNYSGKLVTTLWTDTLKKYVDFLEDFDPDGRSIQTLYQPAPDTLYQQLMKDSDNFIAEQLLLMCADKLFGKQSREKAIEYAKNTLMNDLPDQLVWWDGSGLSRYNLFTPRTITGLLAKLYAEVPEERLFRLFPAGGVSGTIKNWYKGASGPYVFAKTGTLRNKHCLSGYVKCRSGRVLIFSFMHSNYITGSAPLKEEMGEILSWIAQEF